MDLNHQGVDFVLTEISLANTLLDVAETTKLADHRQKARHDAELAYRTALRFLPRLLCSSGESAWIQKNLELLKVRLTNAGVALEKN